MMFGWIIQIVRDYRQAGGEYPPCSKCGKHGERLIYSGGKPLCEHCSGRYARMFIQCAGARKLVAEIRIRKDEKVVIEMDEGWGE